MNPLDRVVSFFSAEAGLIRAKARAGIKVLMNYDAASKGRRTQGWKSPASSADGAGYGHRIHVRQLARDMVRNRPLAARAREVIVGAVVGTGIMPSVHAPGTTVAVKDRITAIVARHLLSTDIDALRENTLPMLQEIAMSAVVSDGEILVRRRIRDPRLEAGLALPFQIELMEADYLNTNITANGENMVVEGVEYGPTGAVEAYHLWSQHPGAVIRTTAFALKSTRVAAQDIIHVRRTDRPGQTRGVSWFAPVMMTMGEISDYQEAQILKQRMAALLAGVVIPDENAADVNLKEIEDLAPGALVKLPAGNKVEWTNPPKVDNYKEFMAEAMGMVAMGLGITRESLSGDLSGVNFSSARMGHMVMDRNVERWQQNVMIEQFCSGVERWLLDAWALMSGLPKVEFTLDWTAPRRPLIDPTREIPASIDAVDAGLTSMQRTQRQMGYDPEIIRRERVQDLEMDAAAGLSPRVPAAKPPQISVTQTN